MPSYNVRKLRKNAITAGLQDIERAFDSAALPQPPCVMIFLAF
jgi:hypothetical protein